VSTRIYVVGAAGSEKKRLVKASSRWQAIRWAIKDKVEAKTATTTEVADLMAAGVPLEVAEVQAKTQAPPTNVRAAASQAAQTQEQADAPQTV